MSFSTMFQTSTPPVDTAVPTGAEEFLAGLAWIDAVGLGFVVLLALLGIIRGLWWQVMRLVGLVAAVGLARTFAPKLTPHLQRAVSELDPRIAQGAAWVAVFFAGLGLAVVVGRTGRRLLKAAHLDLLDRFGGGLAGGLTGLVFHSALLVALSQLGPSLWVRSALEGTQSQRLLETFGRRWPVVLAQEAQDVLWLPAESAPLGSADDSAPAPETAPQPPLKDAEAAAEPSGETLDPPATGSSGVR